MVGGFKGAVKIMLPFAIEGLIGYHRQRGTVPLCYIGVDKYQSGDRNGNLCADGLVLSLFLADVITFPR